MEPVRTPRRPVRKTIGGIEFEDSYAWLLPDTEEALSWERDQVTRAIEAARQAPGAEALVHAVEPFMRDALTAALGLETHVAGRRFWLGVDDNGAGQAIRCSEDSPDDPDDVGRVLVDATSLTRERGDGRPTTIVYLDPSPDGRRVAFSHGPSGEGFGVYSAVDVDSGRVLEVSAPTMLGNATRPAWLPDGGGFYLHGRSANGGHQMGFFPVPLDADEPDGSSEPGRTGPVAPADLTEVPPTALGLVPQVSPGGRHVLAVTGPHEHVAVMIADVAHGPSGPSERWRRFVPEGFEVELHGDWLDDDTYVAIATDAPRGRIVAIPAATSTDPSTWRELVPPGELVLRSLQIVQGRLVVSALKDVSLDVRVYELDGTPIGIAPLPPASASMGLVGPGRVKPRTDTLVFSASTFTTAETTYRLDVPTADLEILRRGETLAGIRIEQFFATSKDGTRIPYYVVDRDLDRDDAGRSTPLPTLLTAYGGFNLPFLPAFLATYTPFVQAGGRFVQANLRGGSEYGREWYDAGRLRNKQNVFDDLRAVAEDLIAQGLASPETLAFHGRSNGGLLAGVAAVQQPDLWRVVVPEVPVLDVLEPVAGGPGSVGPAGSERSPGSEAVRAVYAEDYGDPHDPAYAAILHAYSPCHNVADGVPYPAVFVIAGRHDIGCAPCHGRRFVAALQHGTTSGHPVRLRVWEGVGHGSLDPGIMARQTAEWMAFVMDQLGMDPGGSA